MVSLVVYNTVSCKSKTACMDLEELYSLHLVEIQNGETRPETRQRQDQRAGHSIPAKADTLKTALRTPTVKLFGEKFWANYYNSYTCVIYFRAFWVGWFPYFSPPIWQFFPTCLVCLVWERRATKVSAQRLSNLALWQSIAANHCLVPSNWQIPPEKWPNGEWPFEKKKTLVEIVGENHPEARIFWILISLLRDLKFNCYRRSVTVTGGGMGRTSRNGQVIVTSTGGTNIMLWVWMGNLLFMWTTFKTLLTSHWILIGSSGFL